MPVKDWSRYPKDWKAIRASILERAGYRCEGGVFAEVCGAEHGKPNPITGSKVVLTIGHLDHTPENCDPSNLRAWCQRCHLRYDHERHRQNAAATRKARLSTGDLFA